MKERPILFSAPMVRAILEDRKTQTRRVIKQQPKTCEIENCDGKHWIWGPHHTNLDPLLRLMEQKSPYGVPGDRLWVRETFRHIYDPAVCTEGATVTDYRADGITRIGDKLQKKKPEFKWRPSIFMPRWASRITLEIVEVRVERLQTITEEDAKAEGVDTSVTDPSPRGIDGFRAKNYVYASECFADLWRLINGFESWDSNPWIWVVKFKRIKP